jgi:hypothetical protein
MYRFQYFSATVLPSMVAWPWSNGVPFDAARDHDLADVDPVGLELLREQANQLVLRCVGRPSGS